MSIQALNWAWGKDVSTPTQKLVLIALADHANSDGECYPSFDTVATLAGCSPRTARRHVDELVVAGLVQKVGRRRRTDGTLSTWNLVLSMDCTSGHEWPEATDDQRSHTTEPAATDDQHQRPHMTALNQPPEPSGEPSGTTTSDQGSDTADSTPEPSVSDEARRLTRLFAELIQSNGHSLPTRGTKAHGDWLRAMDLLLRRGPKGEGGVVPTPDEVECVIRWCANDTGDDRYPGESVNVRSVPKLRERWSELRLKAIRRNGRAPKGQFGHDAWTAKAEQLRQQEAAQ